MDNYKENTRTGKQQSKNKNSVLYYFCVGTIAQKPITEKNSIIQQTTAHGNAQGRHDKDNHIGQ